MFIYMLELGVKSLFIPPIIMLCGRKYSLVLFVHRVQIHMEMDSNILDSDLLGLMFVTKFEELCSQKVIELYQLGRD